MKKNTLLFLSILFSVTLIFSQENQTTEIFTSNSFFNNSKTLTILTQNTEKKSLIIFKSSNKESKDIQSCKWIKKLSHKQTRKLSEGIQTLSNREKDKLETSQFIIVKKRNLIKIVFKDSKCTSNHTLYYFQKNCNRNFSVKINNKETERMILLLKTIINKKDVLEKSFSQL